MDRGKNSPVVYVRLGDVHECAFFVKVYGVEVDAKGCNGTVEMIWDTEVSNFPGASVTSEWRLNLWFLEPLDTKLHHPILSY